MDQIAVHAVLTLPACLPCEQLSITMRDPDEAYMDIQLDD